MLKDVLISGGLLLIFLAALFYLRRPRWFWSLALDQQKVNLLVVVVSLFSLGVAVIALIDAHNSGIQQEMELKGAVQALQTADGALQTADGALGVVKGKLQKQTDLLNNAQKALKNETDLGRRQAVLLEQQFGIQKAEYEALNRHPIFQLRALIYNWRTNARSTLVLKPNGAPGAAGGQINLMSESARSRIADFVLRNIGTADAVNIDIRAQAVPDVVKVECIDYETWGCGSRSGIVWTLPPRPKNRPEATPGDGSLVPDLDAMYDRLVRIHLYVPKSIKAFSLILSIGANGIAPVRYDVICMNPHP